VYINEVWKIYFPNLIFCRKMIFKPKQIDELTDILGVRLKVVVSKDTDNTLFRLHLDQN